MDGFHRVRSIDQVQPGQMTLTQVQGELVLLANVDGAFYAVSARCTHDNVMLPFGRLQGEVAMCPAHYAQFNVTTGQVLEGPTDEDLRRYAVKVEGEDIFVGPLENS